MSKRFRKFAAVVLASALFLQNGALNLAEEGQPETSAEAVTEAHTEAPAEAPTEKVTEAPTEALTEKPTEAPTEKPTEAPTEKPTEAPTEAPAGKPAETQTEKPTEAPAETSTEKPAEGQTEKKTKKQTEKETSKETEEQTERSERENDGKKISAGDLVKELKQALPYLFAAKQVNAPDELLEGQEVAKDAEGEALLKELEDFSLELANAKSSSDVCVINLYADKDGKLDIAQLDEKFSDHVIDVTEQYYVVNVIAYSADQKLNFSGYTMKLSGETVNYTKGTEPGDILYNFAAMDDEGEISGYEGSLTLGGADRLQGAFLAPQASVTVNAKLAGAVYAADVTVTDSVEELLQIAFAKGRKLEEETQSGSEEQTEESTGETTAAESEAAQTEESETEKNALQGEDPGNGSDGILPIADENGGSTSTQTPGQDQEPETGSGVFSDSLEVMFDGQTLKALGDDSGDKLPDIAVFKKTTTTPTEGESQGTTQTTYELVEGTKTKSAFAADGQEGKLTIEGLKPGTYVLGLVDGNDQLVGPAQGQDSVWPVLRQKDGTAMEPGSLEFTIPESVSSGTPSTSPSEGSGTEGTTVTLSGLVLDYGSSSENYPSAFYYEATITLTKKLLDSKGKAAKSSEIFYAGLFTDAEHKLPVTETVADATAGTAPTPKAVILTFSMDNKDSVEVTHTLKATASPMTFYVAETDQLGNAITTSSGALSYEITLQGADATAAEEANQINATGQVTLDIKNPAGKATITNQLNPPVVKVGVLHGKKQLSGVTLVIKDEKGKIKAVIDGKKVFQSAADYITLPEGSVEAGKTYYLSEVNAPDGYAPAADVPFTPEDGKEITVSLTQETLKSTDYKLTVAKQVYSGQYQLYAQDPNNSYLKNRTFYVALFQDSTHLIKVSDVKKIVTSGLSTSVTFENLKNKETYYVAETDEYGEVQKATSGHQIKYTNDGRVPMDAKEKTETIQNIYNKRPAGYRYSGTVTITKRVTNEAGSAKKVTETFYVGMFRNADYSDKPAAIISLNLNDASGASVRRRILLSGDKAATYYFAEVDANGNRVDTIDTFAYNVSIDQPSVTIARGEDKKVTVTNQQKSSKVTLYLTKRVYQGTALHPVTDTFYMGLFQDAQFTKLYTQPIPLSLKNQSELTLKLTLNLGTKDSAAIYIAETDKSGHVIRNESQFGYNIRAVNSTAVFTQQTREIQTIFLNSIYGSASDDDWKEIMSDENNIPSYGGSDGWFGGNGEIDPNVNTTAAQTGDETPIGLYIGLLAAAVIVLILLLIFRIRKKKDR